MKRRILAAILFSLSLTAAAGENPAVKCDHYFSQFLAKTVGYCIDSPHPGLPGDGGEPSVYFMHGSYSDSSYWVTSGYADTLQALRREERFPPITVVTFDTAATSFFSDKAAAANGPNAYETWLTGEFIPYIEGIYHLCSRRECRGAAGVSMGGFGALKTALRHSQLFSVVAAASPDLLPFNVHEPDEKWLAYFDRHPIGRVSGMKYLRDLREVFTTPEFAAQNDPSELAKEFWDLAKFPAVYLDMGDRDDFGFQEGFARFTSILRERNIPHTATLLRGGDHSIYWDRREVFLRFLATHLEHRGPFDVP